MGNHQSVAGPIRPKSASQLLPNTQQFLDVDEQADPLRNFNLSPPSAAVIGAGVAGVHAAYELGRLGFNVTVFEEKDAVAAGETKYSLPFVGVGLLKPSLARVNLREEFIKGLFPASCPSIIARDHIFHSIFSSPLHRWILARTRGTMFNEEEIMFYTDNLSRLSRRTVASLAARHPALQEHLWLSDVNVGVLESPATTKSTDAKAGDEGRLVGVKTAHPRPIMVDPVGWTRTLAAICEDKFNVRFAFGERLESFHTYLKYNVETTRSIRVSKQDLDDPSKRVFADQAYDVIVLTAGANTGALTSQTCRLPIVGLSGIAVSVENAVGEVAKDLTQLFTRRGEHQQSGTSDASLALLSGPCSLFGYRFTPNAQQLAMTSGTGREAGGKGDALAVTSSPDSEESVREGPAFTGSVSPRTNAQSERYTLSGLMSFDTTRASDAAVEGGNSTVAVRHLTRMEAFLRVMCDQELPLVECFGRSLAAKGRSTSTDIQVASYIRAFSPDGVPIVDHCGGAFNTFVCSGFGDQAMDFAPGSAKILCQLVRHQAEVLLQEDADRQKALGLAAMASGDEKGMLAAANSPLPASRLQDVEYNMQMLLNGLLPDNEAARGASLPASKSLCRWLARFTGGSEKGNDATSGIASMTDAQAARDVAEGKTTTGAAPHHGAELPVQQWRTDNLSRLPTAQARESLSPQSSSGESFLHFSGNPYSTNRFGGLVKKGFRDINLHSPFTYLDSAESWLFQWTDPARQQLNKAATQFARRDNTPAWVKTFVYNNMYYDSADDERVRAESARGLESRQRVLAMHEGQSSHGAELLEHSKTLQEAKERLVREVSSSDLRPSAAAANPS